MKATRILMLLALAAGSLTWLDAAAAGRPRLTLVRVDSEETGGDDNRGERALDGDPDTFWHTQWNGDTPAHPHEIVVELEPPAKIKGFTCLPRQDDQQNGMIKEYEVFAGMERDRLASVAKGTLGAGKEMQHVLFPLQEVRRLQFIARSEVNGQPFTSIAELGVLLEGDAAPVRQTLTVISVDSEETNGEDGRSANAVDGNPATFWHTQWQDASPGCPHEIILKLDPPARLQGLTCLPRQDDQQNGMIKDFEVYVSDDGKAFGEPVAKGTWAADAERKTATFEARNCGYIKLRALSEVNGEAWTSIAEIGLLPAAAKAAP